MGQTERTSSEIISDSVDFHRARVLAIADSCFEVFTVRELLQARLIRKEILSSFANSTEAEVAEAIALALSWRRMLGEAASLCQ